MERGYIDADVEVFIQKGLEPYGRIDKTESYAWLTPVMMKYGVELAYEDLMITEKDFQSDNLVHHAATLAKVFSTGPPVRKLRIDDIGLAEFRTAFHTQVECPSLKELHIEFLICEYEPLRLSECGAFQNLCSLYLGAIETDEAYAEDIASYIAQNKSLRELTLGTSCGGDEGMVMLVEALKLTDTLKKFSLYEIETELSYHTFISFANVVSSNSTLELVSLKSIYDVEEEQVSSCLDQDLYPGAFNKLDIVWPQSLFNELTTVIRKQGCAPLLHVSVPTCAGKKYIRQFFEALALARTLRELHLSARDSMSDAFTDGIAYLLKCRATLRKFMISTDVDADEEHHLMNIFEALKKNRSVTVFEIKYSVLTPRIAASLSELIAVNSTLNELAVIVDGPLMPEPVKVIEKGFDTNYTLTKLFFGRYDEVMGDIPKLLKRNISLENKAALCVIHGVDQIDEAGVDALKKVHFGSGLLHKVQMITGRTTQEALDDIQRAVAHLCQ